MSHDFHDEEPVFRSKSLLEPIHAENTQD